jgi:hypothetical protein
MARVTLLHDASALAREHTVEAIDKIATLINSMDPRVALEAAKTMLDRAHGKPLSAVIVVPGNRKNQATLSAMTDAQLMEALEEGEEELPVLPPPGSSGTTYEQVAGFLAHDPDMRQSDGAWDDPLLSAIAQDGSQVMFDARGNPLVVARPNKLQNAQQDKRTSLNYDDPLLQ